jgi:hypothetical protein
MMASAAMSRTTILKSRPRRRVFRSDDEEIEKEKAMEDHGDLPFEDFVTRLFEMGFTDLPEPSATSAHVLEYLKAHPYMRSFEPPESLRSTIKWLNTGGRSLDHYSITVGDWAADGASREWGEHDDGHGGSYSFGLMRPNEELLAALASGADGFTAWFNSRPVFSFDAEDEDGNTVQGIATADGKSYSGGGEIN